MSALSPIPMRKGFVQSFALTHSEWASKQFLGVQNPGASSLDRHRACFPGRVVPLMKRFTFRSRRGHVTHAPFPSTNPQL